MQKIKKKIKNYLIEKKADKLLELLARLNLSFSSGRQRLLYRGKITYLKLKRLAYLMGRRGQIAQYFRENKVRRLQLGGGPNILPGWLNTDLWPSQKETVILDVTGRFPFSDNSFDYIFCEHMIEHINYAEVLNMLRECSRVLKPGGKLRVSTPDLDIYLGLMSGKELSPQQEEFVGWVEKNWLKRSGIDSRDPVYILNLFMHGWGHMFLYNFKVLEETLIKAGFSEVVRYPAAGESSEPDLRNLEKHGQALGKIKAIENNFETQTNSRMNDYNTIFVEARK